MITDLETLLNADLFMLLVNAINTNLPYEFNNGGLKIKSNSTDNSIELSISYDNNELLKCQEKEACDKERESFSKFLERIEDDMFVELCETIGEERVHTINEYIYSEDLELVRAGIVLFKREFKEFLIGKINYYKSCMNSLLN